MRRELGPVQGRISEGILLLLGKHANKMGTILDKLQAQPRERLFNLCNGVGLLGWKVGDDRVRQSGKVVGRRTVLAMRVP